MAGLAARVIDSPIGALTLVASDKGLQQLKFGAIEVQDEGSTKARAHIEQAVQELSEYFAGKRNDFDVTLDMQGSEFRQRAWEAIAAIPFGETVSYTEIAWAAGSPGASRAAGSACANNPVALIVPCHRVVGSDGSLHGFGGGLDMKLWLLEHEGVKSRSGRVQPELSDNYNALAAGTKEGWTGRKELAATQTASKAKPSELSLV